jgi:hypothetical protein
MNKLMPKVRQYTAVSPESLKNGAAQRNLSQPLDSKMHQDRAIIGLTATPPLGMGT